jgi:hypothetical protein
VLGVYVEHAALVRRCVEVALEGAHAMSARQLASLCRACGEMGNVPESQMLVSTGHHRMCQSLGANRPAAVILGCSTGAS